MKFIKLLDKIFGEQGTNPNWIPMGKIEETKINEFKYYEDTKNKYPPLNSVDNPFVPIFLFLALNVGIGFMEYLAIKSNDVFAIVWTGFAVGLLLVFDLQIILGEFGRFFKK